MSEGMICAEDELGLGTLHAGIIVLPKTAKIGKKLSEVLATGDVVYEVDNKSLSNRSDLWGHYGMAREIAALFGQKLKDYEPKKIKIPQKPTLKFEIKIQDKKFCPRYLGVAIENIKIAPSPEWLRWRLESVGVRAINNIVDITNYVMLELGQPLHAFDFDKLEGSKMKTIIVRTAKDGENINLLDGTSKKMDKSMLVIADTKNPVALAGIMGGQNSEISELTTKIVLESANFDFTNIRKTSTILGLRTEASMRFEKGLDPNLAEMGLKKALALIAEIIPEARVGSKIIDVKNFKLNPAPIKLNADYLNNKVGVAIPVRRAADILKGLGFGVKSAGKWLTVKVPTWRATKDIAIAEDLVEEVVRIYGYENISPEMPKTSIAPPEVNKSRMVEKMVKDILVRGLEMTEVYNYSFVDEKVLRQAGFDPAKHIRLKNSIAKNLSHLRQSLVPNLILNISQNQHFFDKIRVFEMGMIFYPEAGEYKKDSRGKEMIPQQDKSLVGMVLEKGNDTPFYETKDALAALLSAMNLDCQFLVWKSEVPPWAHPGRTLQVNMRGKTIGIITELNPNIQKNFGVKHRVGLFGINFDELANLYSDDVVYRAIPKYPAIEFDLAIIVPRKTVWAEISKAILEVENNLVKGVRLFDVFEGRGVEEGKKSLAFRVIYRSDSRTLKLEEAKKIEEKIIQKLNQKFGAKLRA
jgi:phenylalanyl-tRNA synthetase beta chain